MTTVLRPRVSSHSPPASSRRKKANADSSLARGTDVKSRRFRARWPRNSQPALIFAVLAISPIPYAETSSPAGKRNRQGETPQRNPLVRADILRLATIKVEALCTGRISRFRLTPGALFVRNRGGFLDKLRQALVVTLYPNYPGNSGTEHGRTLPIRILPDNPQFLRRSKGDGSLFVRNSRFRVLTDLLVSSIFDCSCVDIFSCAAAS